jgi:hypothetical protein
MNQQNLFAQQYKVVNILFPNLFDMTGQDQLRSNIITSLIGARYLGKAIKAERTRSQSND